MIDYLYSPKEGGIEVRVQDLLHETLQTEVQCSGGCWQIKTYTVCTLRDTHRQKMKGLGLQLLASQYKRNKIQTYIQTETNKACFFHWSNNRKQMCKYIFTTRLRYQHIFFKVTRDILAFPKKCLSFPIFIHSTTIPELVLK